MNKGQYDLLSQIDGTRPSLLGLQTFVCFFKRPEIMCFFFSKTQEGSISIKDHRFSVNKRLQKLISKLDGSLCIEGLGNFYQIFLVFRYFLSKQNYKEFIFLPKHKRNTK